SNIHDIIPTGNTQIFFVLNENYKVQKTTFDDQSSKRFFFSSPGTKYAQVISDEVWDSVGIIFHAYGAYRLLGIPQGLLLGRFPDIEQLLPPSVKEVQHKLEDNVASISNIVKILDQWLLDLLLKSQVDVARIAYASHFIQNGYGLQKIDDLCSKLFITKRTLELEFKEKIGMSPKMFSRIIRFNKIQNIIASSAKPDFTQIIHDFNYFDQAHFIKEFKTFSGFSPSKYFLRNADMGSLTID
ncbi:MAG: hypothetical protein DI598_18660, partial [Pseudopedobacter saltans]